MGRLILFIIVICISGFIALMKSTAGKVTGNEQLKNTSVKGEAKKVMAKTAKGVSWMEEQWEESKREAKTEDNIK